MVCTLWVGMYKYLWVPIKKKLSDILTPELNAFLSLLRWILEPNSGIQQEDTFILSIQDSTFLDSRALVLNIPHASAL